MEFFGFHPLIAEWFQSRFDAPTEPQREGWPPISRGEHTLIAAPTGSGKTLTAFLACIDRLLKRGLAGQLEERVSVVYVSPLRALSNDMHRNLETPLAEILDLAERETGLRIPLRAGLRTGDTSSSQRAALVRKPPQILVTTPESLYLLLTGSRSRGILETAETVIVDEIHALVRDKRGSHLALTLERLEALTSQPLQRIGLSATQKPLERTARFLVGWRRRTAETSTETVAESLPEAAGERERADAGWVPRPCAVIDVGHGRTLDLGIEIPPSPLGAVCMHEQWAEVHARLVELIEAHRSTLIFVNTRRMAERVTHQLTELMGAEAVSSHHGSLAASIRLETEQKLKTGQLKAVVATASLELGLDIGYIDLVVQLGSPRSIGTFLQRIGRSGHSLGLTPKGRVFALTRDELLEAMALIRAVHAGQLDAVRIPEAPQDVLAQQIVAEVAARDWELDALFERFVQSDPYRTLTRQDFDRTVQYLSEGLVDSRGRSQAFLHHDHVGQRLKARRAARITATSNGGAIPEVGSYRVVSDADGAVVGTLDEDFAIESNRGDIFLLGNTSWRILSVRGGDVNVADAQGAPPTIPFWRGEAPGRSVELSAAVSELREAIEDRLSDLEAAARWVRDETSCSTEAARQAVEYLAAQKAALGLIPSQKRVVFERFFDETGGMQLVVHAPFGGDINRAWGLAMRKRFCRSFDFELQATADDEGFILSLGPQHSFPIESLFGMLTSRNARGLLEQAILTVPMFQIRWRWNVTRALLVRRRNSGKRVPPALQRFRADDLLTAVFPKLTGCQEEHTGDHELPDHPLTRQTMEDCLHEALDLTGLQRVLTQIDRGDITLVARDSREPSPFCYELLNSNVYAFLDGGEIQERRARAVATRRSLTIESVDDLGRLDPAAIETVRNEAQPLVRDLDELHDLLLSRIVLAEPMPELVWRQWLADLAEERRAGAFRLPDGRTAWVAAERLPAVTVLFPDAELPAHLTVPETVAQRWTAIDARLALVRGLMEVCGPIRVEDVARELCLSVHHAQALLEALEGEGVVMRGRFTHGSFHPPQPGDVTEETEETRPDAADERHPEWCHRRLLARIHRLTLEGLRRQIEPVSVDVYHRFLARHQGVPAAHLPTAALSGNGSGAAEADRSVGSKLEMLQNSRPAPPARAADDGQVRDIEHADAASGGALRGPNGLYELIGMLQGLDIPVVAWESDILQLRMPDYDPGWLDELCLNGEVGWGRLFPPADSGDRPKPRSALKRNVPVSLWLRVDAEWLGHLRNVPKAPAPSSQHGEILELLEQRGALFARDILAATRQLPSQLEDLLGELAARGLITSDGFSGLRQLIGERRRGSGRRSAQRRMLRRRPTTAVAGRWSQLQLATAVSEDPGATCDASTGAGADAVAIDPVEQWAWQLLRRWGVMFRDLLQREQGAPRWFELLQVYRRLEARGEIRGGRFIRGVAGEQFATSDAVRQLRALRDAGPQQEVLIVSAADPLNLVGILDEHPRVPATAGNRVLYLDGVAVAALQAGELRTLAEAAIDAAEWLHRPRPAYRAVQPPSTVTRLPVT